MPTTDAPQPGTTLPAATSEFGQNQQYRVTVPSPWTTLQLGARAPRSSPDPSGQLPHEPPLGYHGVSFATRAHAFADVAGRAVLQARGRLSAQAAGHASVSSAEAVVIAAVPGDEFPAEPLDGAAEPPAATALEGRRNEQYSEQVKTASIMVATQAALNSLRSIWGMNRTKGGVIKIAAMLGSALKIVGAATRIGQQASDTTTYEPPAGVTVTSREPVAIYTSGMALHYAAGGFGFVGTVPMDATLPMPASFDVMVPGAVTLSGALNAEVFGLMSASLQSFRNAEVVGRADGVLAGRTGAATIVAPTVNVGKAVPDKALLDSFSLNPLAQRPTQKVRIEALQQVEIAVGPPFLETFVVKADAVSGIEITSTKGGPKVKLAPDRLTLSMGPGKIVMDLGGIELAVGEVGVKLTPMGIQLKGTEGSITLNAEKLELKLFDKKITLPMLGLGSLKGFGNVR